MALTWKVAPVPRQHPLSVCTGTEQSLGGPGGVSQPFYGVPSFSNLPNTNLLALNPLTGAPLAWNFSWLLAQTRSTTLSLGPSGGPTIPDWLLFLQGGRKFLQWSLLRKAFLSGACFGVEESGTKSLRIFSGLLIVWKFWW